MNLHIYAAARQPATKYLDQCCDPPVEFTNPPDKMLFCDGCGECWPATQMVVQVYYDHTSMWCDDGFGCQNKARVAAHAARTRARRSYAARMAWIDRKERTARANVGGTHG